MQLIRPEVLAARKKEDLGQVDLTAMHLHWRLPSLLLGMLVVMVAFGLFAQHHRRVTVNGVLVSSLGIIDVVAPVAGTVERLEVNVGQNVSKGTLLGTLFVDVTSSSEVPVGSEIHALLLKQRNNRRLELEQIDAQALNQAASIENRVGFAQRQHEKLIAQRSLLESSLREAQSFLAKAETVGRGALSEIQLRTYRSEVAQYQLKLSELESREIELFQQKASARAELLALEFETAQSKRASQLEISELDQSIARNVASQRIELRAERAGVIGETLVSQGQPLRAGQSLLQIIPTGSELEAELWLPSEAMGANMKDAKVNLRFRAFPYRTFGLQTGHVRSIGKVAVADQSLSSQGPKNEGRYRLRVRLSDQQLRAPDGSSRRLLVGMQFDADLLLEKRPIYQFFWPEPNSYGAQL